MRLTLKLLGTLAIFAALFAFGFTWRDIQRGRIPSGQAMRTLVGVAPGAAQVSSTRVFKEAFNHIKSDYYQKVNPSKLKYSALAGMVASLGDPHTQFLDPDLTREFNIETNARFAGVGARLSPDPLGAQVEMVFPEGPAEKEGIKKHDLIVAVNGKSVAGLQIEDIVKQIRGKEGTSVTLTIQREGKDGLLTFKIARAQVTVPTVESKILSGTKIGYIGVRLFSEPTAEQFDRELTRLEKQGIKGLIVDVRSNPGGLLDSAVDVLSTFIENKVVVKMRGRDSGEEVVSTTSGHAHPQRYPIVALVNEDSASAAEIFAGVMRDYKMAVLVGEHTYGKASVQNVIPMVDGASVKITIAKYFLPSGQDISRKVDEDGQYISGGIAPEVKAELDIKKAIVAASAGKEDDWQTDSQIGAAVDVLNKKLGL